MVSRKPGSDKPPDTKGTRPEEDERLLFEREFADVRPLRRGANRIPLVDFESSPVVPVRSPRSAIDRLAAQPSHTLQIEVQSDGVVGMAFGVSKETVSAIRRGEFKFEARCDLHKLHAQAARRKLDVFVDESVRRNLRAALVICGRGLHSGPDGPVLAKLVPEALAASPNNRHILAFAPAPSELGGQGAVAVLFRRRSPDKP